MLQLWKGGDHRLAGNILSDNAVVVAVKQSNEACLLLGEEAVVLLASILMFSLVLQRIIPV